MYLINKIDDRTISINGDNYPANFMARSSGDEIIISARTGTDLPFMKGKVGKFEINGAPATSADEAVVLLNSFIGNFRRGGSSPSPTPTLQVMPKFVFLPAAGGESEVRITSNRDWVTA